ncbi:MAG: glycerol-3-phosphate acyltransferase [Oscillospiraceae bacterium]|nr:glycerol-3-phosphate acyltransferase [Oscillospiraceae bacterium]
MIGYWILLLITAFISYCIGSISTLSIASVFVFHRDLHRIGKKRMFVSNFRRLYGYKGFAKLILVELLRDFIPVLIGGILLSFKGHADVGRAFAGFCLVLGRLFPVFNNFRGSHASVCLAVTMFCANTSLGIVTGLLVLVLTWLTRYLSLGAIAGALGAILVCVLVVDGTLLRILLILTASIVLVKNLPALRRISRKTEMRMSLEEDISYKFDETFQ